MIDVDEVEADGGVFDVNLAGGWGAERHLVPGQDLGAAGAAETDGADFLHGGSDSG